MKLDLPAPTGPTSRTLAAGTESQAGLYERIDSIRFLLLPSDQSTCLHEDSSTPGDARLIFAPSVSVVDDADPKRVLDRTGAAFIGLKPKDILFNRPFGNHTLVLSIRLD